MSRHSDPRTVAPSALEDGSLPRDSAVYDMTAATAAALASASGINSGNAGHEAPSLPADFASQPLAAIWLHLEQRHALDGAAKHNLRQDILSRLLESVESHSGAGAEGGGGAGGGTIPHSIQWIKVVPEDVVECRGADCIACRRQEPRIESVTPTCHVLIGSHTWHVQRWLKDEEQLHSFITLEEGGTVQGGFERFIVGGRSARRSEWILSIARQ